MKSLTLNKIVALGVLGAFAMLLLELRFDHRNVLGEHWQAWMPLLYSGTMIVAGGAAMALWERGGRALLFWGFGLALVVGIVGFWMHNKGEPQEGVERVLAAWAQPISAEHHHGDHEAAPNPDEHDHATGEASHLEADEEHAAKQGEEHEAAALQQPPVLAPLSFAGLGLLGMLACARRFEPRPRDEE